MLEFFGRTSVLAEDSLAWLGRGAKKWGEMIGNALIDFGYLFSMRRPRLLRMFQGGLRRWAPIFRIPGVTLVTRADDVQAVLERDDDFLLGPVNEKKFLSGEFIISLDPGEQYDAEEGLIHAAFPDDRIEQLRRVTSTAAGTLLPDEMPQSGTFDVVPYAERITVAIVKSFWGLKTEGARSRVVRAAEGDETMRLWLRKIAAVLGSRASASLGFKEVGEACAEEFMRFLKAACDAKAAERDAGEPEPPDVLGRIVWREKASEVARRNIAGLIITGAAVVTKGFAHAFEQLLLRPEALEQAREAARRDDYWTIEALLMEALRFNTVFPMIPRHCPRSTTLAAGTSRETEIPAGATVAVGITGAMFDPEFVERPALFSDKRGVNLNPEWQTGYVPPRSGIYLHFSRGAHWCPGDQMGLAEMGAMCCALLRRLDNPRIIAPMQWLRRPLRYDGPPVHRLIVHYG